MSGAAYMRVYEALSDQGSEVGSVRTTCGAMSWACSSSGTRRMMSSPVGAEAMDQQNVVSLVGGLFTAL